jgi:hypothetical protein
MEAGGQQTVSDGSTNKTMDHDKDTTNVCVYSNIFSDFTFTCTKMYFYLVEQVVNSFILLKVLLSPLL